MLQLNQSNIDQSNTLTTKLTSKGLVTVTKSETTLGLSTV